MKLKQQRCVYLRGVSVSDITSSVNTGTPNLSLSCLIKFRNKVSSEIFSHQIGYDITEPIFKVKENGRNRPMLCVTTNSLKVSLDECRQRACVWCRLSIGWRGNGEVVGVPMRPHTIEVNDANMYPSNTFACCNECSLAFLETTFSVWKDAIMEIVKSAHRRVHCRELCPSPNWLLLNNNGGSLTKRQFFSNKHEYVKTGRILTVQCKEVYKVYDDCKNRL